MHYSHSLLSLPAFNCSLMGLRNVWAAGVHAGQSPLAFWRGCWKKVILRAQSSYFKHRCSLVVTLGRSGVSPWLHALVEGCFISWCVSMHKMEIVTFRNCLQGAAQREEDNKPAERERGCNEPCQCCKQAGLGSAGKCIQCTALHYAIFTFGLILQYKVLWNRLMGRAILELNASI